MALLVTVMLCVVLVHAAWWVQAQELSHRHLWGGAAVLAAGVLSWRNWAGTVPGSLCWDGLGWSWTGLAGTTVAGEPRVAMDLQFALLLEFRASDAARHWFWLVPGGQLAQWRALRRALFSRSAVRGSASPPVAPAMPRA